MKISVKRRELSFLVMAIAALLIYMINQSVLGIDETKIRYVVCSLAVLQGIVYLLAVKIASVKSKEKYYLKGRSYLFIIFVACIFFVVSIFKAIESYHAFSDKTLKELFYIVFPAFYAYCLINVLSFETIQKFFKLMLFLMICFYVYETGVENFLKLRNWIGIFNIFDSSATAFENNSYNGMALALFGFFAYFRYSGNTISEKKNSDICFWISLIIVFMVHKRIATFFAICLVVLDMIIDFRGKIPRYIERFSAFFMVLFTILYFKILNGDILQDFNIMQFSTGRAWFLKIWEQKDFLSYGFGSSVEIIGRNLEMDFVKIFLELGVIPLFLFIYAFFRMVRGNVYAYLLILYQMFNMLFSSSLWLWYDWVIVLLTIELIFIKDREINLEYRETSRIRKFFKRKETQRV